jgi:hypothetical protein
VNRYLFAFRDGTMDLKTLVRKLDLVFFHSQHQGIRVAFEIRVVMAETGAYVLSKASCIFPDVTRRKNEVAASLFECFGSDVSAIWPSLDWIAAQHVRRGGRKQGASMSGLGGLPVDFPPFPRRHRIRIGRQSTPMLAGIGLRRGELAWLVLLADHRRLLDWVTTITAVSFHSFWHVNGHLPDTRIQWVRNQTTRG